MKDLVKVLMLSILCLFEIGAMELDLNQQDYDFSSRAMFGFFPSRREIIAKNIEILKHNLNEQARILNLNNLAFVRVKRELIQQFFNQAVQATCLQQVDADYILELLEEDQRLNRIQPYIPPALELTDEVDQEEIQAQGPAINFAAFYQMMLAQNAAVMTPKVWVGKNLELLFNSRPTLENILTLIRYIGIANEHDLELVIDIKNKCVEVGNIINTPQELGTLFGEVIPNGFNMSLAYFERNSLLFLGGAFRTFLSNPKRTRHDFNEVRALLINLRLHPEFELNRQNLTTRINLDAQNLIINVQKMTLEKLKNRVINLYKEVRPVINDGSITKYYLVRQHTKNLHLHEGKVDTGTCALCFDDFTTEDCGYQCTSNHSNEHPHNPCHIDDLQESILTAIRQNAFPLTCGNIRGYQHELPIDLEKLKNRNILNENQIQQFEFGTLLAYHRELLRLQGELRDQRYVKYCPTGDCGTLLFAQDKNQHNVVRCPKCDIQRCFECDHYAHPGVTCEQNGINIQNTRNGHVVPLNSLLRPCPYCLVVVEKTTGCNSVVCGSCGNEFNVQLGKPRRATTYVQLHFDGNYHEARRYLVEGEPGYARELESNFPANHGEIIPDRRR